MRKRCLSENDETLLRYDLMCAGICFGRVSACGIYDEMRRVRDFAQRHDFDVQKLRHGLETAILMMTGKENKEKQKNAYSEPPNRSKLRGFPSRQLRNRVTSVAKHPFPAS